VYFVISQARVFCVIRLKWQKWSAKGYRSSRFFTMGSHLQILQNFAFYQYERANKPKVIILFSVYGRSSKRNEKYIHLYSVAKYHGVSIL